MNNLFSRLLFLSMLCLVAWSQAMAQDKWDGAYVAQKFHSGTGTQADPYVIRTGGELVHFFREVNAGNTFAGEYLLLANDIDLGGFVQNNSGTFAGDFDGGKHHVFNYVEYGATVATTSAFISYLEGSLHDLKLTKAVSSSWAIAGLVYMVRESGHIYNCYVTTSARSYSSMGLAALACTNSGTIEDCYAEGTIHGAAEYGIGYHVAALVYINNGSLLNCASQMKVTNYSGADVSDHMTYSNTGTVENCARGTNDVTYLFDFSGNSCTVEFTDFYSIIPDMPAITVAAGTRIGTLPVPDYDGKFLGWFRYGEPVNENDVVTENRTLFARWEQSIVKQPAVGDMNVSVYDSDKAVFEWFEIPGRVVNLGGWTSTNHGRDSESTHTIRFNAMPGQDLVINYKVSSEKNADVFSVKLNDVIILTASGEQTEEMRYTLTDGGNYTLVLRYSKDESYSQGDDCVAVNMVAIAGTPHELNIGASSLPDELFLYDNSYYCRINYTNSPIVLYTDTIFNGSTVLNIADAEVAVGQKAVVPVWTSNKRAIDEITLDVILPQGVRVVDCTAGDEMVDVDATITAIDSISYRVDARFLSSLIVGERQTLQLGIAASGKAAVGTHLMKLNNIIITAADAQNNTFGTPDCEATLTITSGSGDVDGSGLVDVDDVNAAINVILGFNTASDYAGSADVDGSGIIDVDDVNAIINQILGL